MNKCLVPYPIINSAVQGDYEAMEQVLAHYSKYINTLASRQLYDYSGNPAIRIDEEMKVRLEAKLITKILLFNLI